MPVSVVFPKFNIEKTSGEISNWLVSEGDKVSPGDVLFEVEDDKAAVEVDSTETGFIGELAETGEEIDVGSVVATIFESKEELDAAKTAPVADVKKSALAESSEPSPQPLQVAALRSANVNPTPLARKIARENGLVLDGLNGTGPNGRIQKRDVIEALARISDQPSPVQLQQALHAQTSGTVLNAVWYQKGEGLPVAFLHGFGSDYTSWGPLLSGARYDWPAVALDLPCHGDSGTQMPADLDDIAADVEATLMAHGVTESLLAAHSFGGAVAARIASRGILRVRGLCLFAPAGLSPEINASFISGMPRARSKESLRPWLLQLVEDGSLISDIFLDRAMATRATDKKFDALQRFGHGFFADGAQRFNTLADLAAYLGPVRVIFGRQDRILPVEATRKLPGNVALHLWDNCGHMPQFEHRREALRILEEVRRSV